MTYRLIQVLAMLGVLVALIAAPPTYAAPARSNDPPPQSPAQELLRLPQYASALAFGPDSRLLATGDDHGAVDVWEAATGRQTLALSMGGRTEALAFSPDGRWLAAVSADQGTYLWELSTGQLVIHIAHPGNLGHLMFSPNSAWLVSGGFGTTAHIVDLAGGREIDQLAVKYEMDGIAFSPDSRWLAILSTGSYGPGAVQVWDMTTHQQAALIDQPYLNYPAIAFSPDGKWLAANSGGNNGSPVAIWEVGTWREVARLSHTEVTNTPVSGLAFSGDGSLIATSSIDNIHVWETGTWRELSRLPHTDVIFAMAFSPDGRWVVTGTGQGTPPYTLFNGVWVWDAHTGQLVAQLPHDTQVTLLAFSPNGQWLASAGPGSQVRIWRWQTAPAAPSAEAAFQRVWERQDQAVVAQVADRSWTWGPKPIGPAQREQYAESAGGARIVQYYDKSRMEISDPTADPNSQWYVTNGLLPIELMTGRMQVGDQRFETRVPARVSAVGDPGTFPTYADLLRFYQNGSTFEPQSANLPVMALLNSDLSIGQFQDFVADSATQVAYMQNGHAVVRAFADFMQQQGAVYERGRYVRGAVFDPLFVFGLPVTQAFWVKTSVGGVERPVLFQVFERRVLTYNPANPPAFRVEMGNVGQHYYQWRYGG